MKEIWYKALVWVSWYDCMGERVSRSEEIVFTQDQYISKEDLKTLSSKCPYGDPIIDDIFLQAEFEIEV